MNVDHLKPGTKLMWDAPEPYQGYSKDKNYPGRVVYPIIVTSKTPPNNKLTCHIRSSVSGSFLYGDIEYLRYPTEEELKNFTWPDL